MINYFHNYLVVDTKLSTFNHVYQMVNIMQEMFTKYGIVIYIYKNINIIIIYHVI